MTTSVYNKTKPLTSLKNIPPYNRHYKKLHINLKKNGNNKDSIIKNKYCTLTITLHLDKTINSNRPYLNIPIRNQGETSQKTIHTFHQDNDPIPEEGPDNDITLRTDSEGQQPNLTVQKGKNLRKVLDGAGMLVQHNLASSSPFSHHVCETSQGSCLQILGTTTDFAGAHFPY